MKYVIFSIILLTLVALIIDKRNQKEHFQDSSGEQDETLTNLLNSINLNNNLINQDMPISFDNLNINSISNELLEKIESQLNLNISNLNRDEINNMGIDMSKRDKLDSDIKKFKLINNELKKRRLERKNRFKLIDIRDRINKIKNYDENNKNDIYGNCPLEPFSYNEISNEYSKYDLDITRHPVKWHGLPTPSLNNKLPYNFVIY